MFQASQGGARPVTASFIPEEEKDKAEGEGAEEAAGEKAETTVTEEPDVQDLTIKEEKPETPASAQPQPPSKGRVIFIYTCPSGSPVKFRMVYSSSVRGVQQDAIDKAGMDIVGKVSQNHCANSVAANSPSSRHPISPT